MLHINFQRIQCRINFREEKQTMIVLERKDVWRLTLGLAANISKLLQVVKVVANFHSSDINSKVLANTLFCSTITLQYVGRGQCKCLLLLAIVWVFVCQKIMVPQPKFDFQMTNISIYYPVLKTLGYRSRPQAQWLQMFGDQEFLFGKYSSMFSMFDHPQNHDSKGALFQILRTISIIERHCRAFLNVRGIL